jgi:Na+/H+-dicarboxylate symporter
MPSKQRLFTTFLVTATLLGIAVGWLCNYSLSPMKALEVAANLSILTDAFLRLIKMVIAPLVFASLVSAIARMGGAGEIGRIGIKALVWFLAASCVSLFVGLVMAHWLQPGASLHLPVANALPSAVARSGNAQNVALPDFMSQLVPRSIIEAMGANNILQIVVFSIFMGMAAA